MIWIRADANKEIGMGHLMRCLSVAKALKARGVDVLFLMADDEAAELLSARGQSYRVLHSHYRSLEAELPTLLPMISNEKPDLFLADSYSVTGPYLEQLHSVVRTACIDDCGQIPAPVDILINYNIYGSQIDYGPMAAGSSGTQLLLGPSYAPLRPEFAHTAYNVREEARQVLVTAGGSDPYDLSGQFLQRALSDPDACRLQYHVVSGAFHPHIASLCETAAQKDNVHIHRNVTDMASLMQSCDIAVTAGGSTMYELCAVGVPILSFSFVENQRRIVECFREKKISAYGGDYVKDGAAIFDDLLAGLKELAADRKLRQEFSQKERNLVDGQGAERLACALTASIQKP